MNGAGQTFIIADSYQHVWGYYALATGAISHNEAIGRVPRNMPGPIPVIVLRRLAMIYELREENLVFPYYRMLLLELELLLKIREPVPLLVHALNDKAKQFYEYYDFTASPVSSMTLMLRLY
ncbi:TPA: GNAT family N-acetyltransferase [Providencia alcalifaciens]